MKLGFITCSLLVGLGLTNRLAASADETNAPAWATYTDAARHFHFQYPTGWKISAADFPVMHYREVFVSVSSTGPVTVGDLQTATNAWSYGPAETIRQLPAGSAYLDIGYWEFPAPRFGPGIHEMTDANLSALLKKSPEQITDPQLITRTVDFCKWGRRWSIVVYLRSPVEAGQRQTVEHLLTSFHFDGVPAGDEIWAIGEARKQLPPEADPDQYTREGGSSIYYDQAKKDGDDVIVGFTKQLADHSKKRWCYRALKTGLVVSLPPGANPFPKP